MLSGPERERIKAWVERWYPGRLSKRDLRYEWEHCKDWHESNGVKRASWEATFRNWLRKHFEMRQIRAAEKPQEPGRRGENVVPISDYLDRLAGGKSWEK